MAGVLLANALVALCNIIMSEVLENMTKVSIVN